MKTWCYKLYSSETIQFYIYDKLLNSKITTYFFLKKRQLIESHFCSFAFILQYSPCVYRLKLFLSVRNCTIVALIFLFEFEIS